MISRYNIALLSIGRPETYIEVAQRHFSKFAQGYLLGNESLPHITICQFLADSSIIPPIINELEKADKNPLIKLTGLRFSNKHNTDLWGASLSVERSPELMDLLQFVVNLLQKHQLEPLNKVGDLYTPHLTLARINRLVINEFSKDIFDQDQFALALGESDDLGQFTKVLHQF